MEQVLEAPQTQTEDPRYLSAYHLERLGVTRLNRHNLLLRCRNCGEVWSPTLNADATLPAGYWRCPNHCNG